LEWIKERQPATDVVENLLTEADSGSARLLMSAINVGEVYYHLCKYHGETLAEFWRERSATLPVSLEVPTCDEIWDAARLKGRYPIAYAGAFAAALAQKYACALVTGDPDFRGIPKLELDWIGRAPV
jgi:predicted nucleic acid-binding protein